MSTINHSETHPTSLISRLSNAAQITLELAVLLSVPLCLAALMYFEVQQRAFALLLMVATVLLFFYASYEKSRPSLRQIMPTLTLAALAAAGRILFAPIPDFKPVSAIAIIAGATLGRRNGFMVGSLAAFTSNFFFGQGPWTPWQMYAWGIVGYTGGLLCEVGFLSTDKPTKLWKLIGLGFFSAGLYGLILNTYQVIGFVVPFNWAAALASMAAALPFDAMHGIATAVFLCLLFVPWSRRIHRVVIKYDL